MGCFSVSWVKIYWYDYCFDAHVVPYLVNGSPFSLAPVTFLQVFISLWALPGFWVQIYVIPLYSTFPALALELVISSRIPGSF